MRVLEERKWGLEDDCGLCAEGMGLEYSGLDFEGLGAVMAGRWP